MNKTSEAKTCPHCKKTKLRTYLNNITSGAPMHFWCKKCQEEFYLIKDMGLMTRKEFLTKKRDWA